MTTKFTRQFSIGAGVLSIGMGIALAGTTQAAPRTNAARQNSAVRQEQRDVNEARRDVKQEQRDLRQADTSAEYQRERRQLEAAKQDLRQEQQELRDERRDNHAPQYRPPVYNAPRPVWNNAPVYNAPRPTWNSGYSNQNVDFYGTVLENTSTSRAFRVRGNNGSVYTVTYNREAFSSGQRVKIVGYSQNGLVVATDINRV